MVVEAPHARRWAGLVVVLVAVFVDLVDTTVTQLALPSIARDLTPGATALEWTLVGYSLAFAVTLVTGGRLGDRYGRRRLFMIGLAGFTLTSAFAGAAVSPAMLVGARVLQGASAALMVPQVLSYIQVAFPAAERARAFTVYGMTFALGGISGPLIGGALTTADLFGLGWRPVFYINVPIGLVTLLAAGLLLSESRASAAPRLDLGGMALVTVALLALLYPLSEGRALGWPWWSFALLGASMALLWLFGVYERRRAHDALVPPALFRYRGVLGGLLVALAFFTGVGYMFALALHLQQGLGYSALRAGVATLPFAVGVVVGSGAASGLVPRLGRRLVTVGSLVMAAGVATLGYTVHHYGNDLSAWQLAPGMVLAGLGLAGVASTLVTVVLAHVPPAQAGGASGVVNTTLQVGAALGVAALGSVYFGGLDAQDGSVAATTRTLTVAVVLFALTSPLSLILPSGSPTVDEPARSGSLVGAARPTPESAAQSDM